MDTRLSLSDLDEQPERTSPVLSHLDMKLETLTLHDQRPSEDPIINKIAEDKDTEFKSLPLGENTFVAASIKPVTGLTAPIGTYDRTVSPGASYSLSELSDNSFRSINKQKTELSLSDIESHPQSLKQCHQKGPKRRRRADSILIYSRSSSSSAKDTSDSSSTGQQTPNLNLSLSDLEGAALFQDISTDSGPDHTTQNQIANLHARTGFYIQHRLGTQSRSSESDVSNAVKEVVELCFDGDSDDSENHDKNEEPVDHLVKEMPLIRRGKRLISNDYYEITNGYYKLERNCKLDIDFQHVLDLISSHIRKVHDENDHTMEVLLLATKSGIYYTHNKMKESKRMAKKALALYHSKQLSYSEHADFLMLRIASCFALWTMRVKKYSVALEWVDKATPILAQTEPCDESARMYYVLARYITGTYYVQKPTLALKNQIIGLLEKSRYHLQEEFTNSEGINIKIKTHIPFRTSGIMRARLDSPDENMGRQRGIEFVTRSDLIAAKDDLERMRMEMMKTSTSQTRARLHIFESCYHLRCAQMSEKQKDIRDAHANIMQAWFYVNKAYGEVGSTGYQQAKDAEALLNYIESHHLYELDQNGVILV